MNKSSGRTSRRTFLKAAAATTATAGLTHTSVGSTWQGSPNDRIRVASIGFGQQGRTNTAIALSVPGVELAGVADLYQGRRRRAQEIHGANTFVTTDYREFLGRSDVDAVIVSTPDHWHTKICLDAMSAGKDVYCEKPMVQTMDEGSQLVRAEQGTRRILQVGSQRTSSPLSERARDLLAKGSIGQLIQVEAQYRRSSMNGAWQYVIPPDASPQTVDWETFLGHAPRRAFDADRFFRWRSYWDYGTGIPGDLFVHLLTGIHFITNSHGPERITADGGIRFWKDGREVPDLIAGLYRYPETSRHPAFNVTMQVNFADMEEGSSLRFVGSEGVMTVGRTISLYKKPRLYDIEPSISTFPQAMQDRLVADYRKKHPEYYEDFQSELIENISAPPDLGRRTLHFETFFAGMRSRKPVLQNSVFGFRAAAPALAVNISYRENRVVQWDPEGMKIVG